MLGCDKIILDGFEVVQLSRCVQKDGSSCGVICLKVCIIIVNNLCFCDF